MKAQITVDVAGLDEVKALVSGLTAERDAALATLAEVRGELDCEPGKEVDAVRALSASPRPAPGDTLTPDDFGEGEAGVLRLAALLSEAPDGAVVRNGWGREWRCVGGASWHTVEGVVGQQMEAWQVAKRTPLTVVAWPS